MEGDKNNNSLKNIKSKYILKEIFDNLEYKKLLEIIKYNKNFQLKLNIEINDYKTYKKIIIEIIPTKDKYGDFIHINENDKLYYHIYFNDNKEEIKNKYEIKRRIK